MLIPLFFSFFGQIWNLIFFFENFHFTVSHVLHGFQLSIPIVSNARMRVEDRNVGG